MEFGMALFKNQTELECTPRFPVSLYEPLIWDLEEVSVQILSLDESHRDSG